MAGNGCSKIGRRAVNNCFATGCFTRVMGRGWGEEGWAAAVSFSTPKGWRSGVCKAGVWNWHRRAGREMPGREIELETGVGGLVQYYPSRCFLLFPPSCIVYLPPFYCQCVCLYWYLLQICVNKEAQLYPKLLQVYWVLSKKVWVLHYVFILYLDP